MPEQKNLVFLVIDALRYDVTIDDEVFAKLAPNLHELAAEGFVQKVTTNAQSTQFVLPSLFALNYPLDHGGYDNGVRERPKTYVESLRDAGYETSLFTSCNQLGLTLGYDRGFDNLYTTNDFRIACEFRLERTLRHHINLWKSGEVGKAETIELVQKELGLLLDSIEDYYNNRSQELWTKKLKKINYSVTINIKKERNLLHQNPDAILDKLVNIPGRFYWRFMGETKISSTKLLRHRAVESLIWRTRKLMEAIKSPFFPLGHYPSLAEDVFAGATTKLNQANPQWHYHFHVMDVHDGRSLNRPLNLLRRHMYLWRWLSLKIKGKSVHSYWYDTALSYVDHELGGFLRKMKAEGVFENTAFVVTGDHGCGSAGYDRKSNTDLGFRTHREDIEVPAIFTHIKTPEDQDCMLDSMGVTATILYDLGVPFDESYKGLPLARGGRNVVISENAGRGNADLKRRDLFFTLSSQKYRMMILLVGDELQLKGLYDLASDPEERINVAKDSTYVSVVDEFMSTLRSEREEIMSLRKVKPNYIISDKK